MRRWARYRAKIKRTPDDKFPKRPAEVRQTHADKVALSATAAPGGAIAYKSLPTIKRRKPLPYLVYARRKRNWLIFKIVCFVAALAAFVCLWFFWVIGS